MSTDDDRIAFLAGDHGVRLPPSEERELEGLRALLRDPAMWAEPDPALEDRIVAAIAAEAAGDRSMAQTSAAGKGAAAEGAAAKSGAGNSGAGNSTGAAARRPRRHAHGRGMVASVLGGAAAAAIAITIAITTLGGPAAHHYVAALAPAGAAPGASGTATLTQTRAGWRVDLRASGLPRLDNGRYYEAWMVNASGVRVPIGTFNEGPDVTLWSGVPPKEFPTVSVTAQGTAPAEATGSRVLVGEVHIDG